MDRICVRKGLSPHMGNIEHLSIYVNQKRLDEYLAERISKEYLGLIPAWLDYYDDSYAPSIREKEYVWEQIQLCYDTRVLPVLLCPDDFDFSCTVVIVEVIDKGEFVHWNRFGIDCTELEPGEDIFPQYIGKNQKWFDNIGPFVFKKSEYQQCIKSFCTSFGTDN